MYAVTASPRRMADVIINRIVLRYVWRAGLDVATRTGVRMRSCRFLC